CISPIELIRKELSLTSGEYHMESKNKDFRKKDPLSDDTIEDKDSLVGQEGKKTKVTTYDQVTSPIAFRGLLHELSTPIKGKTTETNNKDEDSEDRSRRI
ncbi:6854_t:CDS:2, partial [Funneliformis caledonium]